MAIGERMHFFRTLRGMTQKYLGQMIGFSEKTADVRIAQYESGKRGPKDEMINQLADVFDVAPEALKVPDIDNYIGLMHTLFTLEDRYGLTVTKLDDQVCLKQDINHANYDMGLADDLRSWYDIKLRLTSGSITTAEYDHWRYHYPEDKAAELKSGIDAHREERGQSK